MPRIVRKLGKRQLRALLLLIVGLLLIFVSNNQQTSLPLSVETGIYKVSAVFDGDTLEISMDGRAETIRMIGVDTPETHDPRKSVQCYGKAASAFTKSKLSNKSVRLEADPLSTNRDRYDRLLRYVYVNDLLINAEIIKQGYGFANTGFPFSKMEEFKDYQRQAELSKLGLWSNCMVYSTDKGQQQTNDD